MLSVALLSALSGCGSTTVIPSASPPPAVVTGAFDGVIVGAGFGTSPAKTNLQGYQTTTGKKLGIVMWYMSWSDPNFPAADAQAVVENGSIPEVVWEPVGVNFLGVLQGRYDATIEAWASGARNFGKPIFLRFAHEMNGNWYSWSGTQLGGGTFGSSRFIDVWRYVHNKFVGAGATNVIWVYCPNNTNTPDKDTNTVLAYYPGDAYVDWIGIDGFNLGGSQSKTFDQLFADPYAALAAAHSSKPMMMGEFGCAEAGGNKAAWIQDAYSKILSSYPRFKSVQWFEVDKSASGEADWRVESSTTSLNAYKAAIGSASFITAIP